MGQPVLSTKFVITVKYSLNGPSTMADEEDWLVRKIREHLDLDDLVEKFTIKLRRG